MIRNLKTVFLTVVLFALTTSLAVAIELTRPTQDQAIPAPAPGKAQIVFLRATGNFFSAAVLSVLYEVGPDKDILISPIMNKNKVVYDVEPGQKTFMSIWPAKSFFMKANVEAGKRYYVLVRYIHSQGFQLRPMRKSGPSDYNTSIAEFPNWLKDTVRVEPSEEAVPFITKYQAKFDEVREKGYADFKAKTPEQIAELTLNLEDGFDQ